MPYMPKASTDEQASRADANKRSPQSPWKLPLVFFCTLLAAIGLMDYLIYADSRNQINASLTRQFNMNLDAVQNNVAARLDTLYTIAQDVVTTPSVVAALSDTMDAPTRREQLEGFAQELKQVVRLAPGVMGNILLFDAAGTPVMDLQRNAPHDAPWNGAQYKDIPAPGSSVRFLQGEPQFYAVVPVVVNDKPLGTCMVTLNMSLLKRQLSARFAATPGLTFALLNDMGTILTSNSPKFPTGEIYPANPQRQAMLETQNELGLLEDGTFLGMSRRLPSYKVTMVISEKRQALMAPLLALLADLLTYSALALLASVGLLSWYCFHIISRAEQYQDRYTKTVELAALPTWEWDSNDNLYRLNSYFCAILGFDSAGMALDPTKILDLIHPDDRKLLSTRQILNPSQETQRVRQEVRLRHQDGHWHWVELQGTVFAKGNHTPPVHASGLAVDIHAQRLKTAFAYEYRSRLEAEVNTRTKEIRESEAALRIELTYLQAALNNIPDVICLRDMEKRLLYANTAFLKFFHATLADVMHKKTFDPVFTSGLSAETLRVVNKEDDTVLSSGQTLQIEQELKLSSGHTQYFVTTKSVLKDGSGNRIGILCNSSDITMRKFMEKALEKAREESEAAQQSKNEFLANMSHEIRNPLSGILGLSRLAQRFDLPQELRHYLDSMELSGKNLLVLVNNLLNYSKIESGQLVVENAPIDLQQTVNSVVEAFRSRAVLADIGLKYSSSPTVPLWISADSTILRQVMNSLLTYAVTYSVHAEVQVRLWTSQDDEPLPPGVSAQDRPAPGRIRLFLSVQNHGPGITPDQYSRLLLPFPQAVGASLHRYGGTGFGLVIARVLVEAMGGLLHMESNPDEGTRFTVEMQVIETSPAMIPQPIPCTPDSENILNGKRILLVDDDEINRIVIMEMLHTLGCEVSLAKDGDSAVAMALENTYDALLMDLQMPRMDGYTATRMLRDSGSLLPIVAISASAMLEDHNRSRAAGMLAHVDKPIDIIDLRNALLTCLQHSTNATKN